jgi:elongation factor G
MFLQNDLIRGLEKPCKIRRIFLCYAGSALENFWLRSLMTGLSFILPSPPSFHKKALGQVFLLRYF